MDIFITWYLAKRGDLTLSQCKHFAHRLASTNRTVTVFGVVDVISCLEFEIQPRGIVIYNR